MSTALVVVTAFGEVPGVEPRQVAAFFEAAATLCQQAPWREIEGDAPFCAERNAFQSGLWYAGAMGQSR